jgi:ATP-dependent RNA helicase DDX60
VRQVVLSKLPALRGNYPLTPTLSLRLANLLSESDFAPAAVDAVQALFRLPRLTVGSDVCREQTVHQLRFSMEYLIRIQLLDSQGTPLHPWYSLAGYLSTPEPANFALLALFRAGYIHTECENTLIEAKRRLMHLLAFLFNRDFLSKSVITDKDSFLTSNRSPSKILLPPMDKTVYDVLRQHNDGVLEIFTEFAITYSVQQSKMLGVDSKLPLSKRDVNEGASSPTDSEFVTGLKSHRAPVRSRSAFVATSGHGDIYKDVNELVRTVRTGIDLNKQALPFMDVLAPGSEETRFINAYLYDFYIHGQDKPLVQANHIPRGEVWYRLQEFSMVLASIVSSIGELITRDRKDDDLASAGAETEHPNVSGGAAAVPDDWAVELPGEKDEAITGTTKSRFTLPIEKEKGDDVEAAAAVTSARGEAALVRPSHVSERDWRVYEVFYELQEDFNAKFTAMWA